MLLAAGWWWAPLFGAGRWLLLLLTVLMVADVLLLFMRRGIEARRSVGDRFSNGDDNEVRLLLDNSYPFAVSAEVIDEIPHVFQRRDVLFRCRLSAPPAPQASLTITYRLRPTRRGVYGFGLIRVLVVSPLGLVRRRISCGAAQDVKVYPSYLRLRQFEFLAIHQQLREHGIKRIRHIGHHTEFEQIKDYVVGDDYRTINWRATARRHQLMVNVYQDERSQQIFNLIDKGRPMQQAFHGMTLLDYAINTSLHLSYVAMERQDRAGLCTFSTQTDTFVPASRQSGHMQTLLEALYAQQMDFGETDFSALCVHLNKHVQKRSLFILYTNFVGMVSLRRQLPFLAQLARRHRLLVVFFEDVQLRDYIATPACDTEDEFRHVIAEKFAYEQRLMVTTLKQHGIYALLTTPEALSVNVINKYIEIRQRQP